MWGDELPERILKPRANGVAGASNPGSDEHRWSGCWGIQILAMLLVSCIPLLHSPWLRARGFRAVRPAGARIRHMFKGTLTLSGFGAGSNLIAGLCCPLHSWVKRLICASILFLRYWFALNPPHRRTDFLAGSVRLRSCVILQYSITNASGCGSKCNQRGRYGPLAASRAFGGHTSPDRGPDPIADQTQDLLYCRVDDRFHR